MGLNVNLLGVARFASLVLRHLLVIFTSLNFVLHQQTYDETSTRTIQTTEPPLDFIMVIESASLLTS